MSSLSLAEFADRLSTLMPSLLREFTRRQPDEISTGKITLPQFLILHFLNKQGETKMKDLAHFMTVTTAAVTGIIDRLVKCGYVVRVFSPQDRRIIKIGLNAKGEELVKKVNRQRRQMTINIFGKISEAERQDYLRILTRIHDILTKEA